MGNPYLKVEDAGLADKVSRKNLNLFKITFVYFSEELPLNANGVPVDPTDTTRKMRIDPNRREPSVLEVYDNLSPDPKSSMYYEKIVNTSSNLVTIRTKKSGRPRNRMLIGLRNGSDGQPIESSDYRGEEAVVTSPNGDKIVVRSGLLGFSQVDEISILCAPDENSIEHLSDALIDHCELLKDRFAILHCKHDAVKISKLESGRESKYAALYFPWIKVDDPLIGGQRLVPPGGHIAGIFARVDTERGVHKAPANEVVKGAVGVQVQASDREQEVLNMRCVNVIRPFSGRGIVVCGARTISTDNQCKYVNVQRFLIFIKESISEGIQWSTFESNNEKTWPRVVSSITEFLMRVWRSGALMGTTLEAAFFVHCDRSTMTQDDIDNGRLVVVIGLAPIKPAEFVVFMIVQANLDTQVVEL